MEDRSAKDGSSPANAAGESSRRASKGSGGILSPTKRRSQEVKLAPKSPTSASSSKPKQTEQSEALNTENNASEAPSKGKPQASKQKGDPSTSSAAAKAKAKEEKKARRAQKVAAATETTETPSGAGEMTFEFGRGPKRTVVPQKVWPKNPEPKASEVPDEDDKRVGLFRHLYRDPDKIKDVGHVHLAIQTLGLQIRDHLVCGSSARAVAMLNAMKEVITSYSTPPGQSLSRHLTKHLNTQVEHLDSSRPLAISQRNAIRWLKVDQISHIDPSTSDTDAKANLITAIDAFIRDRFTAADTVIARAAAARIVDGDVVLTYAKSHVVELALLEAVKDKKDFKLVIVDSRPLFEGKALMQRMAQTGIDIEYCLISALSEAINGGGDKGFSNDGNGKNGKVSKVLLGAHAMLSNGSLVSRVGTAMVGLVANDARVPVLVCCESIKFSDRVALDSFVSNDVGDPDDLIPPAKKDDGWRNLGETYDDGRGPLADWRNIKGLKLLNLMHDTMPSEYIQMVITEHGNMTPSSVPVVIALNTNA